MRRERRPFGYKNARMPAPHRAALAPMHPKKTVGFQLNHCVCRLLVCAVACALLISALVARSFMQAPLESPLLHQLSSAGASHLFQTLTPSIASAWSYTQLSQTGMLIDRHTYQSTLQEQVTGRLHQLQGDGWQLAYADYADLSKKFWVMVVWADEGKRVQLITCADLTHTQSCDADEFEDGIQAGLLYEQKTQAFEPPLADLNAVPDSQTDATVDGLELGKPQCEEVVYELNPAKVKDLITSSNAP